MNRELIDIHPHVISSDLIRYPPEPLGGVRSNWSQEQPATWEELLAALADMGVQRAAVVQSSTTYGHNNSYLADCIDSAPRGFVGVCSIGLLDSNVSEQIKHWVGQRGMAGVRVFVTGTTMKGHLNLDDERTWPGWEAILESGVSVSLNIDPDAIPELRNVLARYPDLRVVLDHGARTSFAQGPPYVEDTPLAGLADYPNVYIKVTPRILTSAMSSDGGPSGALVELVNRFGSHRLAWGSNWPAGSGTYREITQAFLPALDALTAEDARNVACGTAQRLYRGLGT